MSIFDNKYKKCVKEYELKFLNENSKFFSNVSYEFILMNNLELIKMDLEQALRDLKCNDIEKYLNMFTKDIMAIIDKSKGKNNNQRKLYDEYLERMRRVVSSSLSASEKRGKLSQILEEAYKNITDDSLRTDLYADKYQGFLHQINMRESENLTSYLEGGIKAMEDAPGARRARAIVREELKDMFKEIDSRKGNDTSQAKRF